MAACTFVDVDNWSNNDWLSHIFLLLNDQKSHCQLLQMYPRNALRHDIVMYTKIDAQCDKLATVVS